MKRFIVRETRLALEFQKKTVKAIFRVIGLGLRYAFWLLPWVLFLLFAARPFLNALNALSGNDPIQTVSQPPVQPREPLLTEPREDHHWDDFQKRIDSGVRTLDRVARRIRSR